LKYDDIMGNGASIRYDYAGNVTLNDAKLADEVEYRCKSGYYNTSANSYADDFTNAVEAGRLDIVEILVQNKHINDIHPFHITCKFADVEIIEILVSAGCDPARRDAQGRTALHMTALSSHTSSYLCGDYLCLEYPELIDVKDKHGQTALHLAVLHHRRDLIRVLLEHKPSVKIKNNDGYTALDLARHLNNIEVLEILQPKAKTISSSLNHNKDNALDIEKIMLVWDKFFENASKYTSSRDDSDGSLRAPSSSDKPVHAHSILVKEWSQHILVYEPSSHVAGHSKDDYYVIDKGNQAAYSVSDYIKHITASSSNDRLIDFNASAQDPLPSTLSEVIHQGWMSFYDSSTNTSSWLHMSSNRSEDYLPIGRSPELAFLHPPSLFPRHHDADYADTWLMADQSCSEAWLIVFIDNSSSNDCLYYHNQLTGQSSWREPYGWRSYCDSYCNAWKLACYESDPSALFWWDELSGNTAWAIG
jgi:hypothetical protein